MAAASSTSKKPWIHNLHKDEPESITYTTCGQSIPMKLFLRSCHEFRPAEVRLHFVPEHSDGCYSFTKRRSKDDGEFIDIVHGCHFVNIASICENGLRCEQIKDNSPFRLKREQSGWAALDPIKNDGDFRVVWFGANVGCEPRPPSRYGNLLLRKRLKHYTTSACKKCYNQNLSASGNVDLDHDGWHFFFCELYQMKNEIESRFLISGDSQLPHRLAHLYYPGRPGGTWHLEDRKSGRSFTLTWFYSLEKGDGSPSTPLSHSVAFMIDVAPSLKTLDLSLTSGHNRDPSSPYVHCLKKVYEYGPGQICPDELSTFSIYNPNSKHTMRHFHRIRKANGTLFRSV